MNNNKFHSIGQISRRKDGFAKVTGRETYVSDVTLPRMYHARVVRSPHPHARIVSVDVSAAEALGAICLTHENVPDIMYNERQVSIPEKTYRDRRVLSDTVRHVGEGVAAVAARTPALAEKAMQAIKVQYEPLAGLFDPYEAMAPGAVSIYDEILLGETKLPIKNNIACHRQVDEGDIEKGFKEADLIVEKEFKTGRVYHGNQVGCLPAGSGRRYHGLAHRPVDP